MLKKIIIICCLLVFALYNPVFARRESARYKACHSNIRVLQGAVEMYNMDVSPMMEELNPKTLDILVKEGYLKSLPNLPELSKCEYKSIGNLTDEGFIYCKYHGDTCHIIECEYYKDFEYDQYEKIPQNATNDDIKSLKDKILKAREETKKRVDFKNKLYSYIKPIGYIALIFIAIWMFIPNKKRTAK